MSSIEAKEIFIKQHQFVSSRKHSKISVVSDTGPVIELQRAPSPINTIYYLESSSSTSTITISEEYESLLLLFFKISYFIGITPYYWKTEQLANGQRSVERSSNTFHTVLVAVVHICAFIRYLIRFCIQSYDLNNPFNYFKIARSVLSTSLCSFFVWTLWKRHSICKQLLHHLSNLSYFPNVTNLKRKSVQYPLIIIPIVLLCATSVHRAIEEYHSRREEWCNNDTFGLANFCVDEKYESWRFVVKVLICILNFFGRTTRRLPRMGLLTFALTIWQICKSFAKSLKQRNLQRSHYQNHEIMSVLLAYEELKCISNLICDIIGEMLASEIVEDIVYFSLEVQLKLIETEWFSIFVLFETWLVAFLAYFIAACAAEHIHEVSNWLARDDVLSKLSPGKVTTLHTQLYSNPIGMKGGSLFTLTKSFLANVVTVWVTYFIILLQFRINVDP